MNPKKILFVLMSVFAAILLSGCGTGFGFTNSWPGLTSDGEIIYLASGPHVYAIRMSDGQEIWRYPEAPNASLQFIAQPAIAPDGSVIVGSTGKEFKLVALDPTNLKGVEFKTPAEKWVFSEAKSGWIAGALILNDKVFAPNSDGTLYVIDLEDGFSTKSSLKNIDLGGVLWAQPSTDGNLVFVASMDHHLYAIDPNTYKFGWPAIELGGAIPGTPAIGPDGSLYIGSFASEVVKVNLASGASTLLIGTQGWVWGGPVTDEQNIYFGDLEGNLFAVDAKSGRQLWTIQPDGPVVGSPLLVNETIVFVTESGSAYGVDSQGKIIWQRDVGGKIYTAPVAGSDRIIVAPLEAGFHLAFLDANGNQVNTFTPEN
ncbi:MAG: PQQ-binding-like beta-propeller repeat protein [Anaerolineae bacterium]|nr:PQQ-binding-like beta-propeller repeat protein [Anaerolineae bacterium]MDK1080621.1 PQQ-binding-like beta-propeller repeat protein [Anaerolineae bacterium]